VQRRRGRVVHWGAGEVAALSVTSVLVAGVACGNQPVPSVRVAKCSGPRSFSRWSARRGDVREWRPKRRLRTRGVWRAGSRQGRPAPAPPKRRSRTRVVWRVGSRQGRPAPAFRKRRSRTRVVWRVGSRQGRAAPALQKWRSRARGVWCVGSRQGRPTSAFHQRPTTRSAGERRSSLSLPE